MILLSNVLHAWQTPEFEKILKQEIEQLESSLLPLQQGLLCSSYVTNDKHTAMILRITDDKQFICAKVGIFFRGVIAGCNCADDPTPVDTTSEYCEVLFEINKNSAQTSVTLL